MVVGAPRRAGRQGDMDERDQFTGGPKATPEAVRDEPYKLRVGREETEVIAASEGDVPREAEVFYAEIEGEGLELFARADTPGLALIALGHELDRELASRAWGKR